MKSLIGAESPPDVPHDHLESRDNAASPRRRAVAAAWLVHVRPGTEQAVLREIEYRVASEMANQGGYAELGHRCLLAVGRSAIAATPVRRLRPASELTFPGPVEFDTVIHNAYKEMLRLGPPPSREVRVAVLDTNIRIEDVPCAVRRRVEIVKGREPLKSWTPSAHGAVTVSVIGDIANNAKITLHPVLDKGGGSTENSLLDVLFDIADGKIEAEVVVLCLGIDPNAVRIATTTSLLDRALKGMSRDKIVLVATGNTRSKDFDVLEPARRPAVFAVGAANRLRRRSSFSRYMFPSPDRPAIYMLAPGGDYDPDRQPEDPATVEGHGQRGSSVATAYAAAAIVRSLGSAPHPQQRAVVQAALSQAAFVLGADAGAGPGCAGLIQELAAGWHETATTVVALDMARRPEPDVALIPPVDASPADNGLRDPALDIQVA